jgi:hypothetical protein
MTATTVVSFEFCVALHAIENSKPKTENAKLRTNLNVHHLGSDSFYRGV